MRVLQSPCPDGQALGVRGVIGVMGVIVPPLTKRRIITIIRLYIALNMTPYMDCYWEGAVPKT